MTCGDEAEDNQKITMTIVIKILRRKFLRISIFRVQVSFVAISR